MRFEDAIKLLGRDESSAVKALDYVLGGVLAVAAPMTGGASIALFDPKNDLVRALDDIRRRRTMRLRGGENRQRGELLVAAHTIVVISAYFDAVHDCKELTGAELRPSEQERIAAAVQTDQERLDMVGGLLRLEVPAPGPHRPYDVLMDRIHEHYAQMSRRLRDFLRGLAYWDELRETGQERVSKLLENDLPPAAMAKYQGYLGQFAADCPEFLFWTNVWEHVNTREQVRRVMPDDVYRRLDELVKVLHDTRTGLDGLGRLLRRLQPHTDDIPERWQELAHAYRDDFQRQLFEAGEHDGAAGVNIPVLARGYVNPAFRAVEYGPEARPSEESWWREHTVPVRQDIQGFLAGYLASPVATELPLVVLGHPGAGKSVLTRALAAQLGASGYRPIRVDLRRVPADAPIRDQIENALTETLHEDVPWGELARTAGDAMPVILLDGFDELLQSSSTSRSDYLERIREFQYTERLHSRPLAVIVTSRTVVAHRARIPRGATVLRLEPFDEARMRNWLQRWNDANVDYFTSRGRQPLGVQTVLRHRQLAEQPLLLMMLALYDADENALQRESGEIDQADLYERLLTTFVRREVSKTHPGASADEMTHLIEYELNQLSFAAFAMFNRASQFVGEKDLQRDLEALFREPEGQRPDDGTVSRALTAAQLLVGRFFFVHVARASYAEPGPRARSGDRDELRTYEFLHATFGEYLVSRLAVRAAIDLHWAEAAGRSRLVPTRDELDDSVLYALLSFQPLTARAQITHFVVRLARQDAAFAEQVRITLLRLFRGCRHAVGTRRFGQYLPADIELPTRMAIYSLNVLLLLLAMSSGGVRLGELFGGDANPDANPSARWRRLALSWWAALDDETWRSLLDDIRLDTGTDGTLQSIAVSVTGGAVGASTDETSTSDRAGVLEVYRSNAFVGDPALERVLTGITPLATLGDALFRPAKAHGATPVGALLRLLFGIGTIESNYPEVMSALESLPVDLRCDLVCLVLRQLAAERRPLGEIMIELGVLGAARKAAEGAGRARLLAEIIECAAAHLGRDLVADQALLADITWAAQELDAPELRDADPALYLRMVLTLDALDLGAEIPLPHRLYVAIRQVDVVAFGRLDPALALRVLRAAQLRELPDWYAEHGLALLENLPANVLASLEPAELEFAEDCIRSHGIQFHGIQFHGAAAEKLDLLRAEWERIRQEVGAPIVNPEKARPSRWRRQ